MIGCVTVEYGTLKLKLIASNAQKPSLAPLFLQKMKKEHLDLEKDLSIGIVKIAKNGISLVNRNALNVKKINLMMPKKINLDKVMEGKKDSKNLILLIIIIVVVVKEMVNLISK